MLFEDYVFAGEWLKAGDIPIQPFSRRGVGDVDNRCFSCRIALRFSCLFGRSLLVSM